MNEIWKILGATLVIAIALATFLGAESSVGEAKRFSSYQELQEFVEKGRSAAERYDYDYSSILWGGMAFGTETIAEASTATAAKATDYSTTNIQAEGVDEADIVKSDGEHLYIASNGKIAIVRAYPADEAEKVSEIKLDGYATELFVNKDKLVVFAREDAYSGDAREDAYSGDRRTATAEIAYYPTHGNTIIKVYDISDRQNPKEEREIKAEGSYFSSRMVSDYVYAIVNTPAYGNPVPLPAIIENGDKREVRAEEIYYSDLPPSRSYNYISITSINTQDESEEYSIKTFLSENAQNIYVSEGNIYVTYTFWEAPEMPIRAGVVETAVAIAERSGREEKTIIHKIAIRDGGVEYKGSGEVPGRVLNQFSMDEHEGNFRIATTEGRNSRNNVYVLNEELDVMGKVEGLAPGESIYSARFMGDRAYVVTFRKVDPLFVIDLSEPTSPEVLGKLKIPGYSDYLHPYDENHIIGVGKEAVAAKQGDFAWDQGLKLALFDVSEPTNPREVAKIEIGDRGTDSYALRDHKAFLFDREKKLLVLPVTLAEIDEKRYAGEVPPNAHGEFTWQGAYVFSLDAENGFELRGRVSHASQEELLKSGHYFYSDNSVKRALYIEDVLYTVSERMVKANELKGLQEIKTVSLH